MTMILARTEIDYRHPATYGDRLEVGVRSASMRRSSFVLGSASRSRGAAGWWPRRARCSCTTTTQAGAVDPDPAGPARADRRPRIPRSGKTRPDRLARGPSPLYSRRSTRTGRLHERFDSYSGPGDGAPRVGRGRPGPRRRGARAPRHPEEREGARAGRVRADARRDRSRREGRGARPGRRPQGRRQGGAAQTPPRRSATSGPLPPRRRAPSAPPSRTPIGRCAGPPPTRWAGWARAKWSPRSRPRGRTSRRPCARRPRPRWIGSRSCRSRRR